jgi:hypothetical protein
VSYIAAPPSLLLSVSEAAACGEGKAWTNVEAGGRAFRGSLEGLATGESAMPTDRSDPPEPARVPQAQPFLVCNFCNSEDECGAERRCLWDATYPELDPDPPTPFRPKTERRRPAPD